MVTHIGIALPENYSSVNNFHLMFFFIPDGLLFMDTGNETLWIQTTSFRHCYYAIRTFYV